MPRRSLSDQERDLFESAMIDSAPLKKSSRPRKKPAPAPQPAPTLSQASKKAPEKPARLATTRHTIGIDGNTAERLRRGQMEPQARLDLHGMSERDAHRALATFVRTARMRKLRLPPIVTGKGGDTKPKAAAQSAFDPGLDIRMRGVLRRLTPRWLGEPSLAEMVADVREAHRRHGGSGALYVYLRKSGER